MHFFVLYFSAVMQGAMELFVQKLQEAYPSKAYKQKLSGTKYLLRYITPNKRNNLHYVTEVHQG